MYYRKNCCLSLKQEQYPYLWGLIREHQVIETQLHALSKAVKNSDSKKAKEVIEFYRDNNQLHYMKETQVFLFAKDFLPDNAETHDILSVLLDDHVEEMSYFQKLCNFELPEKKFWCQVSDLCSDIGQHAELENYTVFEWVEKYVADKNKKLIKARIDSIGYFATVDK